MGFDQSHRSAQLHVTEGPMQREASVQRRGGSGSRATKRAALRHEERMAPHGFAAAESLAHRAAAEFQPPLWLRRLALQLKLEPGQLLGIASAVVLLMAIIWSLIARFDVKHDKMNLHADPSIIAGQRGAFHPAGPPATDDFDQTGLHATANPWPTHLPKTASEATKILSRQAATFSAVLCTPSNMCGIERPMAPTMEQRTSQGSVKTSLFEPVAHSTG
jgi:hypothetical protein